MPGKTMTLRLSDEQAAGLVLVATVEQRSVSETARDAIHQYVQRQRENRELKKAARETLDRYERLLGPMSE